MANRMRSVGLIVLAAVSIGLPVSARGGDAKKPVKTSAVPAVGEADIERILSLLRPVLPEGSKVDRSVAGEKPRQWASSDRSGVLIEGVHDDKPFRIYFLPRDWIGVRKRKPRRGNLVYWEGVLLGQDYKTVTETEDAAVLESLQRLGMWTPSLVNGGWGRAQEVFRGRSKHVERVSRAMVEEFCRTDAERNEAVRSLIVMGVPAEGLILQYAAKGVGRTREFCLSTLSYIRGAQSLRILEQALSDPAVTDRGRKYAAMALEKIADPKSAPAVLAAFDAYDVREARSSGAVEAAVHAAAMMAKVNYQPAAPAILDWMKQEPNPHYKTDYARALASLRYRPAIPLIEKMCETREFSAEWALKTHGYLGDLPEIALLRLTGDWGKEAEGGRLLLLAPEKVEPAEPVTAALLIENCGKEVLSIDKFLWGSVLVNGKTTKRLWQPCYDGPSGPAFGEVWVRPLHLTLNGKGPWQIQYEGHGHLKSNILTLPASPQEPPPAARSEGTAPGPANGAAARPAFRAAVVLMTLAPLGAAGAAPPDSEGPVSLWRFDGSLADEGGKTKDNLGARNAQGTETAPRFLTAAELPGTSGRAVALGVEPGDAESLTAPISADVKLGHDYTIEAWIHPTQVGGWNRLVLRWGGAPEYAYHLALHNGAASLYHGQSDGRYLCAEGGRVAAGRWYHLAGVARRNDAEPAKSTLSVYLNGRRVATAPFDGTIRTLGAEGLGIGDSAGAPSGACRYRGYVDEVALWDRALAPEEIAAHWARRADVLNKLELARRRRETARRAALLARFAGLGLEEIVFAERAPGRDPGGHYYANFGYSCIDPDTWIHGADGGRLLKLNLRTGELTALVDDPDGAVRDPQVHYDARKVLFSYRKGGTHRYHLHEINTDGSGLRRLTDGPWDDVEPTYLPDGDVMFCSTRCRRWIGCWLAEAATLHRCDADGRNLRMVSSGSFTENTPAVLPDGRVLYTRWEYVNRDAVSFHHLWTVNPDGTGQMVYFGNQRPGGVFIDARPIPGTGQVVLVHSPGHGRNEHAGHVAIVAEKSGPNAPSAMRNVTRSGDFRDPWPLAADAFLAARGNQVVLLRTARTAGEPRGLSPRIPRRGDKPRGSGAVLSAGLSDGTCEVLYDGPAMVHEPRPIVRRAREPVVPSRADPARATGTLVLADAYLGRNMAGVRRGTIQRLLVLEELPKPANYHGGGSQPIGHGVTSTLKRILGTVPVEPDGSASFEVPALRSVYFTLLDENDLAVKQMRSFVTLQPGETLSCPGCHEPRTQTPPRAAGRGLQALARPPSRIAPVEGVPEVMDFPRDVQPVLDRHCVRCHSYQKRDGGIVLVGDRGPVFSHSFYELLLHWQVKDTGGAPGHGSGRQPGNDRPYAAYSAASPLLEKLDGGHYDVKLSPQERTIVRLWIDTSAQYAGTYAAYGTGQVGGCWGNNRPIRVMADQWPSTPPALEAVERRCGACHAGQLPRHVTDRIPLDPWGDMLSWTRPLSRYSRHRLYNLTRPQDSLILLAPLAREAGGYAKGKGEVAGVGSPRVIREDRSRPPRPIVHPVVFADTADADYQKVLSHVRAAGARLDEIRRFDMPGFRPSPQYVREMQRHGILPASLSPDAPVDVYATDAAYWRLFWHRPP